MTTHTVHTTERTTRTTRTTPHEAGRTRGDEMTGTGSIVLEARGLTVEFDATESPTRVL